MKIFSIYTNIGNPALDRQSCPGEFTYTSYKIFLNDPDIIVYPNGVIGTIQTNIQLNDCVPNYCLTVGQYVNEGTTCIPWDRKDGLGNPVYQTINFEVDADYKFRLTDLSI